MKKLLLMTVVAAIGLSGCDQQASQSAATDNALTPEEIEAGILTPEVMWKMKRAGSSSLSPDGTRLLYAQTVYDMAENRGTTSLYVEEMDSKQVKCLAEGSSPRWNADGSRIYFLSERSGSSQVWVMDADGSNARQVTGLQEGAPAVEGFGISPDEQHIWWVQQVQVADRRSSDVHRDMPKSKARIYDDLMARHWDYWDEGSYRHIFVGELADGKASEGVDILGAEAAWDAPLAPYFDMAEIAWNNAGTRLAYTCKPLTGMRYAVSTDSDIFVYDLASGTTQNICKPDSVNYPGGLTIQSNELPGYDKYPVWSPDDRYIAFLSQRRAGNESDKARLFLYDTTTGAMTDLTTEFDYNAQNVVWEDASTLLFVAPIEATHQICRVRLTDEGHSPVEVLTRGDHDLTSFSTGGGRAVAERATISSAPEFFEVSLSDGSLTQISEINRDIYDHIRMGEVQKRWVKTTDGKQMLTWVILPPDFDPAKKYPVLLYCQGFIAHCGIFDFDSMYGETEELWFVNNDYGGAYWEKSNATAQRSYANSPHKFVSKWDTPILIITGEYDFRIPYTQSLEAFTAARLQGVPARLVEFEDEAHQVFKPQNSMVWNREFFGWLDKYVKQQQ